MDRCGLWTADNIERHRLMRVASEAANLKVAVARVEGIAERGRRLRRPLKPSIRWFQATQASLSASLRASFARCAEARIELP
jgi:hypothetical protein